MADKRIKSKPHITPNVYISLVKLFNVKGWKIVDGVEYSTFGRFINTLSYFDENEQKFLINLTGDFIHIPQEQYAQHIYDEFNRVVHEYTGYKLYVTSCCREEDVGHIKSSSGVLYNFRGTSFKQNVDISKIKLSVVDYVNDYYLLDFSKGNRILMMVDDFIGTGETAVEAIRYAKSVIPSLTNDKIVIFSIVGMKRGLDVLNEIGVKVFTHIIVNRGISDNYMGEELDTALMMMAKIEDHLHGLREEFQFGYKKSEALVCMERCPNNTFPVYWLEKNIAPYER